LILSISHLRHRLPTGETLCFPDLQIAAGERVALLGPSGSGKTTLLHLITGITPIQSGAIRLLGHALETLSGSALDRLRATQIGLIFQTLNLLPYLDAQTNAALGIQFSPERRARVLDLAAEMTALFAALGLDVSLMTRPVNQLSTGQQQRVAAVRALLGRPALIVADEPTSALDPASGRRFLEALFHSMDPSRQAALVVP